MVSTINSTRIMQAETWCSHSVISMRTGSACHQHNVCHHCATRRQWQRPDASAAVLDVLRHADAALICALGCRDRSDLQAYCEEFDNCASSDKAGGKVVSPRAAK
jgi:hypothetical protein